MGKSAGANHLAAAAGDAFATEAKPLPPVAVCKLGKTFLKAHLFRIDNNDPITDEVITAAKGSGGLTGTTAGPTAVADYGTVDPGSYKFSIKLSADRANKFKPFKPQSAAVPAQVDFHATLKIVPRARLRIVVFDKKNQPIGGVKWNLTEPVAAKGITAADGLIEVEVPWNAADAALTATLPAAGAKVAKPVAVKPPSKTAPVYPIAVDWARFLPKEDACKLPETAVKWTGEIDLLPDADTADGWKGRLVNVGFTVTDDTRKTRSVKAYQRLHNKDYAGSGVLADISGALKTLHDKV